MKFEDYLRNKRLEMDVDKPNEELLWAGISEALNKEKRRKLSLFKVAAAIIVLAVFSFFTFQLISIKKNQQYILAKIDPNLAAQEAEFKKQIKSYYEILEKTDYQEKQLITSKDELEYIDTLIMRYMKDLETYGPNQRLISSLMDLYQKKIKVLDRMLNEIEKNKRYDNHKADI